VTEAQKVAREVEYNLWYVASTLGATKDRYTKKSHVYIFEDTAEWGKFLQESEQKIMWAASFAYGDELFSTSGRRQRGLRFPDARARDDTRGRRAAFSSHRWPLWLNEGLRNTWEARALPPAKKADGEAPSGATSHGGNAAPDAGIDYRLSSR
jgi:hypothetical protein